MDEKDELKKRADSVQKQIDAYKRLSKIKDSVEFQTYFQAQFEILAQKLIWAFSSSKEGDNIQDWNDFCKIRGEIVARLQPIQDVYSAKEMGEYLTTKLQEFYGDQKA